MCYGIIPRVTHPNRHLKPLHDKTHCIHHTMNSRIVPLPCEHITPPSMPAVYRSKSWVGNSVRQAYLVVGRCALLPLCILFPHVCKWFDVMKADNTSKYPRSNVQTVSALVFVAVKYYLRSHLLQQYRVVETTVQRGTDLCVQPD